MKRGAPLKRGKPMARKPMRRRLKSTKYARRERDWDYMGWVKRQRCLVHIFGVSALWRGVAPIGRCSGAIEAHHAGERGLGQKAGDRTCLPICSGHHRERTDLSGAFHAWERTSLRDFENTLIRHYQGLFDGRDAVGLY